MPDIGGIPTYQSTLTGQELDEALRNIGQVQDAVERTEASAQTAEKYGQIVEQNQAAIQAIEDNLASDPREPRAMPRRPKTRPRQPHHRRQRPLALRKKLRRAPRTPSSGLKVHPLWWCPIPSTCRLPAGLLAA